MALKKQDAILERPIWQGIKGNLLSTANVEL
jgi:hypothetical protein